jgi:hypothetical protein
LLHPKSASGAFVARLALKVCASRLVQKLFRPSAARRARDIAADLVFPDYGRRPAADEPIVTLPRQPQPPRGGVPTSGTPLPAAHAL